MKNVDLDILFKRAIKQYFTQEGICAHTDGNSRRKRLQLFIPSLHLVKGDPEKSVELGQLRNVSYIVLFRRGCRHQKACHRLVFVLGNTVVISHHDRFFSVPLRSKPLKIVHRDRFARINRRKRLQRLNRFFDPSCPTRCNREKPKHIFIIGQAVCEQRKFFKSSIVKSCFTKSRCNTVKIVRSFRRDFGKLRGDLLCAFFIASCPEHRTIRGKCLHIFGMCI